MFARFMGLSEIDDRQDHEYKSLQANDQDMENRPRKR